MKTFVVKSGRPGQDQEGAQQKEFVIDFDEMDKEETPREYSPDLSEPENIEINICEDIGGSGRRQSNPFKQVRGADELRLKTHTLNFSGNSVGSGRPLEPVDRLRKSERSESSEHSKDNLDLDMTPDKGKRSSIDYLNSSGKKHRLSDFKPQRANALNLDHSINSRPSFLDRKPYKYRNSEAYDRHWECLSFNTNDLINSEALSLVSDKEKQGLLEEVMELQLDQESKILMVELLREKSRQEAEIMLGVLRKMPWMFEDTLRKRRKELLESKRLRKEKRLLHGQTGQPQKLRKGEIDKPR